MSKSAKPAKPASDVQPIDETNAVLTALERVDQAARITVLSAAIAFYKIGNAELNAVK
jgi:hypothetical protein